MTFTPTIRKLTADEYQQMGMAGILCDDERIELIDGTIYEKTLTSDRHNGGVNALNYFLSRRAGDDVIVSTRRAIRLDDYSEPEPDIVVSRFRADFYRKGKPRPKEILLIVEAADVSLPFDRGLKLARYAAAGIVEYWIANLVEDVIEVYRDPSGDAYARQTVHRRGETLSPLALPDLTITVAEILG